MGTVVVSIDAELGWGYHDLGTDPAAPRLANARWGWRQLASLLETNQIPATWAVVGHLHLRDCDGTHAAHPAGEGWFARDGGSDAYPRELRFADGLVETVRESAVDHELATHTFSHVVLGAPDTTAALARAEVEAARAAARERGLDPTTLVFPRNSVGHRDVLADAGIECYRGPAPVPRGGATGRRLRKLGWTAGSVGTPPLVTPRVDEYGLVDVPASLYLFGFEGLARTVSETLASDPVVRRAKNGIDAAATGEGVCHLWLHPNDVVRPRDVERVRTVVEYVARRRAEGAVTVETMGAVARGVRRADAPPAER